ncbi:MAG TPA: hypothetical protein VFP72_25240 [Kineosporiaceae bacterium]|nr:hypothetical protein [Kineosporiaceae bacterium]
MADEHPPAPASGDPEPRDPATADAAQADRVPGEAEPGDRVPGEAESGDRVPGDAAQADPAPGEAGAVDAGAGGADGKGGPAATRVLLRRAPRYRAFVLTGALVGLLAALVISYGGLFPLAAGASSDTVFTYFGLAFALVGGLLGAGAAILAERRR